MTEPFRVLSHHRRIALLAAGMAGVALLGGCTSQAPRPDKMAQQARDALGRGETPRAIALSEQAVLADGRNPALRLLLANAYLRAGRFESAHQAFADAIELGDDSSRGAIGLVLSDLALGHNSAALDTINTYGDVLPAADLGLALAMAGENQRGIDVLTGAIRRGQNGPKVRENLALAYALSGMWAEARIMAAQDIPADKVDARIQSWAAMARPEDARRRVASLVGAPVVSDTGQPEALALAHFPGATPDKPAAPEQAVAAVATPAAAPAPTPAGELPPVQAPYASGALARIDLAPSTAPRSVSIPVVEPVPATYAEPARVAPTRRVAPTAAPVHGLGTHLVQLGAFNSAETAQRAWHHFQARNPRLQGHASLITKVTVNGRDFWRVQAAGFAGQASAAKLCGSLRAHGGACLVMAVSAAAHVNGVETADAHAAQAHPAAPVRPAAAHPVVTRPGKVNAAR
jgi:tetratricopeptide (TPR) repeat protein